MNKPPQKIISFLPDDYSHYPLGERKKIIAGADRLIDNIDRRFTGDFWTPVIWAQEAHNLISEELGADWRQKYVVWDCACGTKNLTRDYPDFAELYCSTLHQEELEIASDYNSTATTFQYDFLNDDIDLHNFTLQEVDLRGWKLPAPLLTALAEKKPIVFFTNPPYGQATSATAVTAGTGNKEGGIADTQIGALMRKENFGHATMELCTQFIYRVQLLAQAFGYERDLHLFFFEKNIFASPNYSVFLTQFNRQFKYHRGFMFNAGEFSDTAATWAVVFTHFSLSAPSSRRGVFPFTVKEKNVDGFGEAQIIDVMRQTVRMVAKNGSVRDWAAEISVSAQEYNGGDYPRANGFNLPAGKNPCGVYREGALGYLQIIGGSVQKSDKDLFLQSTMNYTDHGLTVTAKNFDRVMVAFAIRKAILPSLREKKLLWVKDKDVFRRPSENFQQSKEWQTFVNDCAVYGLFCENANMTALRDFAYHGKKYDVKNEFFYLSVKEVARLAAKHHLIEIEKDAAGAGATGDSFVYRYLSAQKLSAPAEELLTSARAYTIQAFKYRREYDGLHPEYHLLAWDAGWLQQYKMTQAQDALPSAKNATADAYAEFKRLRRELGDQILARAEADEII